MMMMIIIITIDIWAQDKHYWLLRFGSAKNCDCSKKENKEGKRKKKKKKKESNKKLTGNGNSSAETEKTNLAATKIANKHKTESQSPIYS